MGKRENCGLITVITQDSAQSIDITGYSGEDTNTPSILPRMRTKLNGFVQCVATAAHVRLGDELNTKGPWPLRNPLKKAV